jgi:BASS family bile acid:Na+ symporter
VGVSAGLMVMLVGSSAILSPALLRGLARPLAGDQPLDVDVVRITLTLLFGQVLPLLAGMAVTHWRPRTSAALVTPSLYAAKILNLVFFTLVVVAQYKLILQIRPLAWAGMLALLLGSVFVGWACGGADGGDRRAMALTTAVRNKGVAMVIATSAFAGTPAVSAAMIYGLASFLGALLLAVGWARLKSKPQSPAPPVAPVTVGT